MHENEGESINVISFIKPYICVFVCYQLENGVSHRESKRTLPNTSDPSAQTESSSHTAERNFVTETTHNGYKSTPHRFVSSTINIQYVQTYWFVSTHVWLCVLSGIWRSS